MAADALSRVFLMAWSEPQSHLLQEIKRETKENIQLPSFGERMSMEFPKSIVSDRDKVFTSTFWQHLFKIQVTTLAMSSAYHPQSDGQSEALNKCVEMYLHCFTFQNPKGWLKVLAWAEFRYNTCFHSSLGMTPFQALYGKEPPSLYRYATDSNDSPEVQQILSGRDVLLAQLRANLTKAQQRMKDHADKKRRELQFKSAMKF
jgi:hypothetical protein